MGRKDAFLPDRYDFIVGNGRCAGLPRLLIQELQDEEAGMALVHMKTVDLMISEGAQHPPPADPEDHFLTEPVMRVAAVKKVCELPVPLGVFRQLGVEKKNRRSEERRVGKEG